MSLYECSWTECEGKKGRIHECICAWHWVCLSGSEREHDNVCVCSHKDRAVLGTKYNEKEQCMDDV